MYLYIHNDIYIYCNLQYYNWIYIQYTGIYIYMERERGKKRETDIIGNVYIYIYTHTYIYTIYIYIYVYSLQNCGMYQVIYQGNVMG